MPWGRFASLRRVLILRLLSVEPFNVSKNPFVSKGLCKAV